jgi:uncharacterized paraquat-inducible protein A
VKKFRKCDMTKYRRRVKKQRENTADARKERHLRHLAEAARAAARPRCPLCGYPLTLEGVPSNIKRVFLNRETVFVHINCPTEANK